MIMSIKHPGISQHESTITCSPQDWLRTALLEIYHVPIGTKIRLPAYVQTHMCQKEHSLNGHLQQLAGTQSGRQEKRSRLRDTVRASSESWLNAFPFNGCLQYADTSVAFCNSRRLYAGKKVQHILNGNHQMDQSMTTKERPLIDTTVGALPRKIFPHFGDNSSIITSSQFTSKIVKEVWNCHRLSPFTSILADTKRSRKPNEEANSQVRPSK